MPSASPSRSQAADELMSVVADCLPAFTTEEYRHYFKAAEYDPKQVESALDAIRSATGRYDIDGESELSSRARGKKKHARLVEKNAFKPFWVGKTLPRLDA